MRRRTPTISTKLAAIDHIKFEEFCRMEGKSKTEIARKAILLYMRLRDTEQLNDHQSALEKRVEKMENRHASLLVKIGIGVYALMHLLWTRTDEDVRPKLFAECWAEGIKQMRAKLRPEEESLRAASRE
ncbi:hypothetical protein BH10CYA1_BH10CYA1_59490 [soil metagenome]